MSDKAQAVVAVGERRRGGSAKVCVPQKLAVHGHRLTQRGPPASLCRRGPRGLTWQSEKAFRQKTAEKIDAPKSGCTMAPCRYGAQCYSASCKYDHPADRKAPAGKPHGRSSCRYGRRCKKPPLCALPSQGVHPLTFITLRYKRILQVRPPPRPCHGWW